MDGYNYNPYYHGGAPPPPNPGPGYPSVNPPPYPAPAAPFQHSGSFSSYPADAPPPNPGPGYPSVNPPPAAPFQHSGSFSSYPADAPPQPPYHSNSGHLPYHHPPNDYPAAPYTTPPYPFPSFSPQPSLQQHGSFHQDPFSYPPPSSDGSCAPPYGRQDSSSAYGAPPTYSNPPLEGMLANVRISEQAPTYESSTVSGSSYYAQSPHSAPAIPFSASQHGTHSMSQHGQNMQIVHSPSVRTSLKVLLLHGNLDVWVLEGRNLPNMDGFSKTILGTNSSQMTSDSYVTFSVANAVLGRTYVISNSVNPDWHQHFYIPVAHHAAEVKFMVKDSDVVGSELMGTVEIPAEQIYTGMKVEGVYPVLNTNGKPCNPGATLRLSIQYTPVHQLSIYHQGVAIGPDCFGVPGTYFPLRKGGKVTLYQDAHVPDGCLPEVVMEQGTPYMHGKCWVDITDAISHAHRFIYITGWSVYHNVQLVRDAYGMTSTLGDLLKSKSQEGVRVLLLVWDDPTSTNILGFKKEGVMSTHDEETRRFFKNSSVKVLLCPRSTGKRHGFVKQQETGLIYTHHQKTVILDSDAGNNKRKIIAFVGGLDLCDGRYDTPKHPLFRTLQTVHKDDYHNPTFTGPNTSGPREPWHDLHTRIDGPAAYDVLQNFEERWLRVSKPQGMKKLKRASDDTLLKIDRIPDIIKWDETPYLNDNDPETWHVQIFRSIDSNSVKGFPKEPKEASSKNLVCGKNILVDMSIHTAYIRAIRAAQHFIYIENQYFLGSSFNWNSYQELGANNLIPTEIALKIASKIRANESFAVYVVIPMWPEGIPTDIAVQRILLWQNKTMEMMYETIYKALVQVGREKEYTPQDYLNFFCLGNREAPDINDTSFGKSAAASTPSARAQKNRRFMIYVHSKGMIVDDEYLIVGSANINQRSLEGTRDTEIAMGAYQPQHTWAMKHSYPHGQIHAYRMSLWAEHTGVLEECFNNPESINCMRRVRAMGEMNWDRFISSEVTEMTGHLLKYPVQVDEKGKVTHLPGCSTFPDVGGNICGSTGAKFLPIQENLTI